LAFAACLERGNGAKSRSESRHSGSAKSASSEVKKMTCTVRSLRAAVIAPILFLGLLGAEPGEAAQAIRCRAPLESWTQVELYLGRGLGGDAVVSEEAFQDFLAEDVTPLFPDGLSVIDVAGQFRDSEGTIVREPTKLLILLVPDVASVAPDLETIIAAYKERFDQQSVLHAEQPVCVAFE
jgi:hypothetical protein